MKKSIYIIIVFCMCLFCACSSGEEVRLEESESALEDARLETTALSSSEVSLSESHSTIFVHVCGKVNNPAVYEFENGARVVDAIEKAGGFMEEAAIDYLNLARQLTDGEKLYVPDKEEALESESVNTAQINTGDVKVTDTKININTASKEELLSLKGIGDSRAEDIINYRTENGKFAAIEDIMKVPGIKQGAFNKIKDNIKVE